MGPGFYFRRALRPHIFLLRMMLLTTCISVGSAAASLAAEEPLFHDSHFHLTNYIQEGTDIEDFVDIMGDKVRATTPEIMTAPARVKANSRNSAPVRPPCRPIGR